MGSGCPASASNSSNARAPSGSCATWSASAPSSEIRSSGAAPRRRAKRDNSPTKNGLPCASRITPAASNCSSSPAPRQRSARARAALSGSGPTRSSRTSSAGFSRAVSKIVCSIASWPAPSSRWLKIASPGRASRCASRYPSNAVVSLSSHCRSSMYSTSGSRRPIAQSSSRSAASARCAAPAGRGCPYRRFSHDRDPAEHGKQPRRARTLRAARARSLLARRGAQPAAELVDQRVEPLVRHVLALVAAAGERRPRALRDAAPSRTRRTSALLPIPDSPDTNITDRVARAPPRTPRAARPARLRAPPDRARRSGKRLQRLPRAALARAPDPSRVTARARLHPGARKARARAALTERLEVGRQRRSEALSPSVASNTAWYQPRAAQRPPWFPRRPARPAGVLPRRQLACAAPRCVAWPRSSRRALRKTAARPVSASNSITPIA